MADIILIPGLWLDASSWDAVVPSLEGAGHRARPLTLPGVGAPASESAEIGIADWVDAVVEKVDAVEGPVVVVGHSGGGNVAWGVADRRPERVARVILVDTMPPPAGSGISEFPVVDGVVPFPGWDFFGEEAADLDDDTRERTASRAASVPARVPTDELQLGDDRRFTVPVTVLSGAQEEAELRAMLAEWPAWGETFDAIESVEVVTLGTRHWPQFSKPGVLAAEIAKAAARV
ncbi:alpha/beta hydrolase [Microbacterium sp.]|uniref:alpha/beta fold hydrolase n=1 Tax=Microbacterium sp. TaxID=51671 RepID=UPI002810FD88|nr:alpha/beta hydrolase [Microbacterium sp.]